MSDKWINGVGTINVSKSGNFYINVDIDSITLQRGDRLVLKEKAKELEELRDAGKISDERCEKLKEKLSFIKYTISKAPRNDA